MMDPAPGIRLTEPQRLDWLRLIRSDNIGPRTFRTLINRYGSAGKALEALPDLVGKMARTVRIASIEEAGHELAACQKLGIHLIGMGEPDYPPLLRQIDSAPPIIAVKGQLAVLQRPMVALVGSRNASAAGLAFAERLARGLAQNGEVVVSGLARGIDARAHRSTLRTGTIAVLAGGHARIYPSEHEALVAEIAENGAVISEMPLNWEPRGRDFPRRNRLVSGLSLAVVIIEAARASGSLITAKFAGEQGREVFAVPGSPLDPRAEGTNDLLRQGASICTSAEDVLSALGPLMARTKAQADLFREDAGPESAPEPLWDELDLFGRVFPLTPQTVPMQEMDEPGTGPLHREVPETTGAPARILELLGPSPVGMDELARTAGVPVAMVRSILLGLELEGRLERHGAGLVSLAPNAESPG